MKFNKIDMDFLDVLVIDGKKYPDTIETERLVLKKGKQSDCTVLQYQIHLPLVEDNIGEILLIFDGEIWYKMKEKYRNNGYMTEALREVLKVSYKEHYLSIDYNNKASKKVAKKVGFQKKKRIGKSGIYVRK